MKEFFNKFSSILGEITNKMQIRADSIRKPAAINTKTTTAVKFDMLMTEIALVQERISRMTINIAALAAQVERVTYTQQVAIEKMSKLASDVALITADLATMSEKLATAENSVNPDEFNALVEKLRLSTDALAEAAKA